MNLKYLGYEQIDVLGDSMGAQTALQTTIHHPEVVRRLILVSPTFSRDGSYPEVLVAFDQMGPEAGQFMAQSPLAQIYPDVDWANLFSKLGDMLRQDYDWSADVAAINAPTILIYADADSIRTTHMMEFYSLFGGGQRDGGLDSSGRPITQLAILANTTHYNILESPDLVPIVTRYLDGSLTQAE